MSERNVWQQVHTSHVHNCALTHTLVAIHLCAKLKLIGFATYMEISLLANNTKLTSTMYNYIVRVIITTPCLQNERHLTSVVASYTTSRLEVQEKLITQVKVVKCKYRLVFEMIP